MQGGKNKIIDFIIMLALSLFFVYSLYSLFTYEPATRTINIVKAAQASSTLPLCVLEGDIYNCTDEETLEKLPKHIRWNEPPKEQKWTKEMIEQVIRQEAKKIGYNDVELALKIVKCESNFRPYAINYKNNKPVSVDRGLFMFNSYFQSRISDECAFDVYCSTREALKMLKAGKAHLWVCSRK